MTSKRGLAIVAAAMVAGLADARYIEEMKSGFVIPCEGELCQQTLFCWRGARFADLNQVTSRISAQVNFADERDTCVDAESDDVLSLKSIVFGHDDTAAVRLSNRIGHERGWISSMVLGALLGNHRVAGDGECHGNQCNLQFSPYGLSCVRLCSATPSDGRQLRAEVLFHSESALDSRALYLWALGFGIAAAAPALSERPEMFYLTGGSLGVMFAVALLVLIISRLTTRSGPTKSQLGLAAFFQVGVVYMRKAVLDFVRNYIDWIALYVFVTFVASLGLVHYFLKGEDGKIHLSASLKDIVRVALQLLGAFFIAAPIPSARFRLIGLAVIFTFEVLSSIKAGGIVPWLFGRTSTAKHIRPGSGRKTPMRNRSEDEREIQSEEVLYQPGSSAKTPLRTQAAPPPAKSLSGSRFLTEEEYQILGKEYTDREMRKLLTPTKSVSKKEQDVLNWIRENHARMFIRKEDDDEEVDEDDDETEEMEEDEADE